MTTLQTQQQFPSPFAQSLGLTDQDLARADIQAPSLLPLSLWLRDLFSSFWAIRLGITIGDAEIGQPVNLNSVGLEALDQMPGLGAALATFAPLADQYDIVVPCTRGATLGYMALISNLHPVVRAALNALNTLGKAGLNVSVFSANNALELLLGLDNWAAKILARALQDREIGLLNALMEVGAEAFSLEPPVIPALYSRLGEPVVSFRGTLNFKRPLTTYRVIPWQSTQLSNGSATILIEIYWNRAGYAVCRFMSEQGVDLLKGVPILYGEDLLEGLQWVDGLNGWHLYPLSISSPGIPVAITKDNLFQSIQLQLVQVDPTALERARVGQMPPVWITEALRKQLDPIINF